MVLLDFEKTAVLLQRNSKINKLQFDYPNDILLKCLQRNIAILDPLIQIVDDITWFRWKLLRKQHKTCDHNDVSPPKARASCLFQNSDHIYMAKDVGELKGISSNMTEVRQPSIMINSSSAAVESTDVDVDMVIQLIDDKQNAPPHNSIRQKSKSKTVEKIASQSRSLNQKNGGGLSSPNEEACLAYHCVDCDKRFNCRSQLERHRLVHTGEKPFRCDQCDAKFVRVSNLNNHKRIHTGARPFQCNVCHERFIRKNLLVEHMNYHNGLKPFRCEVCSKLFKTETECNKHKTKHERVMSVCCEQCGSSFTKKSGLREHCRQVHEQSAVYKCSLCSKEFKWARNLKEHMRVHLGQGLYECSLCNKSFARKHNMKRHIEAVHNLDKFTCLHCPSTFDTQSEYEKHMRRKHQLFLYNCEICDEEFKNEKLLKSHMKFHQSVISCINRETVSCAVCNTQYMSMDELRKHVSEIHNDETSEIVNELSSIALTIEN